MQILITVNRTVHNRDQFATQPRNKYFLMKIDKHLEYLNIRTVY